MKSTNIKHSISARTCLKIEMYYFIDLGDQDSEIVSASIKPDYP